jgi:hypothetical protein
MEQKKRLGVSSLFFIVLLLSLSFVFAFNEFFDNTDANAYNITNVSYLQSKFLIGNLSWGNLTNFPSSCPASTAITSLGQAVTCTSFINDANATASYGTYTWIQTQVNGNYSNSSLYTNSVNNSLATFIGTNTTSTYVPYNGANKNINLNSYNITFRANVNISSNSTGCLITETATVTHSQC